jgi:hypothetical protein
MMNEKQADIMLKTLKRMESLLEAIDWKLWNFHQKVMDGAAAESPVSAEDEETEQLAEVIESPKKSATAAQPEKKIGFPSVEKWS